jgi:hypothetical protein
VIFGASGDLTHRKLVPALFELFRQRRLPSEFAILGCARRPWSDDDFRSRLAQAMAGEIAEHRNAWEQFSAGLFYEAVDLEGDLGGNGGSGSGNGSSRVIGTGLKVAPPAAALANGVCSHAFELDGLRKPSAGVHPGAILLPAALAAAEHQGASGKEVLTAFIAGAEVMFRIGVRGENRADIERFTREIVPLVLNGPPSVTGFAGGRPKVEEIVAYWPALLDKRAVSTAVTIME